MSKTFTVAGTSILNGECKVRFANDIGRIKVLDKNGHLDVQLVAFDTALTKEEAAEKLLTIELFANHEERKQTILDWQAKEAGNTEPKASKKAKVEIKAATTQPADIRFAEKAEEPVVETPAPELPKTKDTMTEEEWALLEQVSLAKA
jgi:hypothetical protein